MSNFGLDRFGALQGAYLNDGLDTVTFSSSIIPTDEGTIVFWAKIQSPYDAPEEKVLFDVRGANDNNRFKIYYDASDDTFKAYVNGDDYSVSTAQTDNSNFYTWIHVALTYRFGDTQYIMLYINGVANVGVGYIWDFYTLDTPPVLSHSYGDISQISAPNFSGNNTYIGSDYLSTNQADAFFDEFKIYDFAMSAYQAKIHYYVDHPRYQGGL